MDTTVRPSSFYDESSEYSVKLPPGWDRRLDSWGNLFFVDKNTKVAVREDPRFNTRTQGCQNVGIPSKTTTKNRSSTRKSETSFWGHTIKFG
ncbi:hypothetical protein F5Y16DRAFT_356748 [Xylariaceae sp. FL0255]|nr:hypothetical protein F5Y16DRAFT_356748 [Xylariaceae sp. FL0255]